MHRTRRPLPEYFVSVAPATCDTKYETIMWLFVALSHVMYPTCTRKVERSVIGIRSLFGETNLMLDLQAGSNLEECACESSPVVRTIHANEAEERLNCPLCACPGVAWLLLGEVASDSK